MSLPFEEGLESQLIASEILNTAYREFFNSTMECDKDIFGRVFYMCSHCESYPWSLFHFLKFAFTCKRWIFFISWRISLFNLFLSRIIRREKKMCMGSCKTVKFMITIRGKNWRRNYNISLASSVSEVYFKQDIRNKSALHIHFVIENSKHEQKFSLMVPTIYNGYWMLDGKSQ